MNRISRLTTVIILAIAALCSIGCNSDYQQGYRQGQKEASDLRKELGSFAKPTHQLAEGLGIEPHIDGKSADWNRGYRQGVRDGMKK